MSKPKCTPLKITAYLIDGRINSTDGIVMFDSILYHAWFLKNAPEVFEGRRSPYFDGYVGLPLRRLDGNRWAASKGIYECIDKKIEHYNRRPDFFAADKYNYLKQNKGEINDSQGLYRAYRNPNVIRIVKDRKIVFYAIGHKDDVAKLLSYIPAIGKKYSMGFGIVERWEISDCEEDYTTFHPKHGLMRPLEVETYEDEINYPIMEYAIRPPYWKEKNMRLCYVPISN